MCSVLSKRRMLHKIMKFSFQHRAFYCYLAMSVWIFFLVTAMYKYISVGEDTTAAKKPVVNEYVAKTDKKFRRIFLKACNPPENIVRGSEGAVDYDSWLLQGVIVLTRHGDRGPLTHLRGGDKIPCDTMPDSPLLKSYISAVVNASGATGRGPWAASPGPFHNFPSLPASAAVATHCALGQLTNIGVLQMITVGTILREAYAEKLGLDNIDAAGKKDSGEVISYSSRYRRTYQSLLAALWGASPRGMPQRAARASESHTAAYCFQHCACPTHRTLHKKLNSQAKSRLDSHATVKELVKKITNVIFESQENPDPEIVRDALLAYMCHEAPLPCSLRPRTNEKQPQRNKRSAHNSLLTRTLLDTDFDSLNMELEYINNHQLDFNNEIGRKARDIIGKYDDIREKQKQPLDFDAQMEREKFLYYQQRYMDNQDGYEDVEVVKKNLDADFNFPNDARMDADFDEENYKEPTQDSPDDFCIKNEHIISLFAYLEWSYKQDIRNIQNRKRGLLYSYGLIHNIVQNMIRMISENKPKFVLYSGHDTTLQPLILALGLTDYQHYNIKYASRMIFEVYRKKDLRDEFKFTKRKAVAQDFYFRVVYNGMDVTNRLSICRGRSSIVMKVSDPTDNIRVYNTYLCPIENIVRFIHDDYFSVFNASNYKDACASYGHGKRTFT